MGKQTIFELLLTGNKFVKKYKNNTIIQIYLGEIDWDPQFNPNKRDNIVSLGIRRTTNIFTNIKSEQC